MNSNTIPLLGKPHLSNLILALVIVLFSAPLHKLKSRLEFATLVPHACQSGSLARPGLPTPDLAEISIWFLAVHGRPKGETERYQHAEDLKMIFIFYRRLPTADCDAGHHPSNHGSWGSAVASLITMQTF